MLKVRARTIDDIVRQAGPYFSETIEYDAEAVAKGWKDREATQTILSASRDALTSAPNLDDGGTRARATRVSPSESASRPERSSNRCASRSRASQRVPGIFDVLVLLGRERSLERIDAALRRLAH